MTCAEAHHYSLALNHTMFPQTDFTGFNSRNGSSPSFGVATSVAAFHLETRGPSQPPTSHPRQPSAQQRPLFPIRPPPSFFTPHRNPPGIAYPSQPGPLLSWPARPPSVTPWSAVPSYTPRDPFSSPTQVLPTPPRNAFLSPPRTSRESTDSLVKPPRPKQQRQATRSPPTSPSGRKTALSPLSGHCSNSKAKAAASSSSQSAPPQLPPLMSHFDGGLAALRSQILASDTDPSGPYSQNRKPSGAFTSAGSRSPSANRQEHSFVEQRRESANDHTFSSSSGRDHSSGSSGSFHGHSAASTALSTPNISLDAKNLGGPTPWSPSFRSSQASSSRASNAAFAYSDQLNSPAPGMDGSFPSPLMPEPTSAADMSLGSNESVTRNFMNGGDDEDLSGAGPSSAPTADKAKKVNPLQDLIETETAYVSELGKIIKKAAGAWSRKNFPPPELDTMFRNVESIYKVNRSFLKSLKEIGPNPSSPRALGDLLMKWIDELEDPYARYCDNYFTDFDKWPMVQSNSKLQPLLVEISAPTLPDGTPVACSDRKRKAGELWSLDTLFSLPQTRLKYYKKLYARLLKSTHSGRSDHRLLTSANEKLDELLEKAKRRISLSVLDDSPLPTQAQLDAMAAKKAPRSDEKPPTPRKDLGGPSTSTTVSPTKTKTTEASNLSLLAKLDISDSQIRTESPDLQTPVSATPLDLLPVTKGQAEKPPPLMSVSQLPTSASSGDFVASPAGGPVDPVQQLEKSLDTSRVLDLFTMQPKKCQLRICSPSLSFKRGVLKQGDVVASFTPKSTGSEVVWRRAHIYLLTDLFLIADRMTLDERRSKNAPDDAMWLLFPPLTGKHIKVAPGGGPGNVLQITILKKETLKVNVPSPQERDEWIAAFEKCNSFACNPPKAAGSAGPVNKSAPAPSGGMAGLISPTGAPGGSPMISVTPSMSGDLPRKDNNFIASAHTSVSSSNLDRQGSFNSTSSFPKINVRTGSPLRDDSTLRAPGRDDSRPTTPTSPTLSGPGQDSPIGKPFQFQGARPAGPPVGNAAMAPRGVFGGPGGPPALGSGGPPPRPGFVRPPPNGMMGPNTTNHNSALPPLPNGNGAGAFNGPPSARPPAPRGILMGRPPIPNSGSAPVLQQGNGGNSFGPGPGGAGPNWRPSPNDPMARPPPPRANTIADGSARPPARGPGAGYMRPPMTSAAERMKRPSAPNLREAASGRHTPSDLPVRTRSASSLGHDGGIKRPSEMMKDGDLKSHAPDYSPPSSPKLKPSGPSTSTVSASMRCRLYLKQSHATWKSLGNARLKLYHLLPADERQLVVENDRKTMVSTIVLPDGVERVGKVGVAVEISDQGNRTGIIYMLQMRSEESAQGLFGELIAGSGRTVAII